MIERSYDRELGIIRVILSGEIDFLADLGEHFAALVKMETSERIRILITAKPDFEITNPLTTKFAQTHRENRRRAFRRYASARTAVVTLDPKESAYAEFVSSIGGSPTDEIRLFSTERAAIAWLKEW